MTTIPALPLAAIAMSSLLTGLLGVVIVFAVLVVLSVAIGASSRKQETEPTTMIPAAAPAPIAAVPAAVEPVKLIGVEEKEAAMIMAIVCDELQAPPEELYFKSIRLIDADAAQ